MKREGRRKRGGLRLGGLLVGLALAIGLLAWTIRDRLGVGLEIEPMGGQWCERIPAPPGPEDLQFDAELGMLFISALARRDAEPEGDLYALTLGEPEAEVRPVPRDGPVLRPHGMSLARVGDELYLHVVNHAGSAGSSIEQFRWDDGRLEHLATVRGPELTSPNDVAAVDASRFYVSNDSGGRSALVRAVEHPLGLRLGDVQYYDGERFHEAVGGRSFANGVVLTRDGRRLLVAETVPGTVTSFLRDPDNGALTPESYMQFETGPDNLTQAADGSIWMVGHPRLVDFLAHARDAAVLSPTDVYRIDFYGRTADIEPVLVDDGGRLSGGSTAVVHGRLMWVGNVFDPYLLRCSLPPGLAVRTAPRPDVPES